MLFNFQGPQPNLVRLAAPLGIAYLLYHAVFSLSRGFSNFYFQNLFDSLTEALRSLSR